MQICVTKEWVNMPREVSACFAALFYDVSCTETTPRILPVTLKIQPISHFKNKCSVFTS
jgi:hypothetical protein